VTRLATATAGPSITDQTPVPPTGYYVYGMVRAGVRLPDNLVGIDGARVHTIEHGDIGAVVAEISLERPPGRRSELLAHGAVLDTLLVHGVAVVPVQFGSFLADDATVVEDLLEPSASHVAQLLDEFTGRAQYNLRATYHESVVLAEIVAADPDISALRDLTRALPEEAAYAERVHLGEMVARALDDKRRLDASLLHRAIEPFAAASVERAGSGTDHLLDVAVLVADDASGEFEVRLEEVAESVHERIHLRLLGPLVPYDFVGAF